MITLSNEEYFQHYGAKGMKWGVRKARTAGSKANKRRLDSATRARTAENQLGSRIKATVSKANTGAKKWTKEYKDEPASLGKLIAHPRIRTAVKTKMSSLNTPRNRDVVKAGAILVGTAVAYSAMNQISLR